MAGCATSSTSEERCLSPSSPDCICHAPRMQNMPVSTRPYGSPTTPCPRSIVARQPPQVARSWLSPMDARSCPALTDAAPLLSLPHPSLVGSLSPPLPLFWPGAGGGSLPPGERFAPGSWRPLSQYCLLVVPSQLHAVDLVGLLYGLGTEFTSRYQPSTTSEYYYYCYSGL